MLGEEGWGIEGASSGSARASRTREGVKGEEDLSLADESNGQFGIRIPNKPFWADESISKRFRHNMLREYLVDNDSHPRNRDPSYLERGR